MGYSGNSVGEDFGLLEGSGGTLSGFGRERLAVSLESVNVKTWMLFFFFLNRGKTKVGRKLCLFWS
jgi:hypothetical protein